VFEAIRHVDTAPKELLALVLVLVVIGPPMPSPRLPERITDTTEAIGHRRGRHR